MTNDTTHSTGDAPERIWAYPWTGQKHEGKWHAFDPKAFVGETPEYVRADLSAPRWHRIDDPDNPPPKDGTWFLGWEPRKAIEDQIDVWAWSESAFDFSGFINASDSNEPWEQPTYWQPIPAPPEGE